MNLLYDHFTAGVIGGAVLLIFLTMQLRITEMNIEQTATYIVKTNATSLANWMEEDMLTMGKYMGGAVAFENPVDSTGKDTVTTLFTFYKDSTDTSVDPPVTFRVFTKYELLKTGTRTVGGEEIDVFRLVRSQKMGAGASWDQNGESGSPLSYFRVEMLNRDGKPVSNAASVAALKPDSVRNTRVRFSMASPFETERSTIRQVYYGSTLLIQD